MAVRCSKCGEELLGAVNRCWKCGHTFALRLESDGRPPVRTSTTVEPAAAVAAQVPLDALVLEPSDAPLPLLSPQPLPVQAVPQIVQPQVRMAPAPRPSTSEMIDARRASIMAMGGTVSSLVLGVFAAVLGLLWPPAALIALLGLALGIWGLGSPRRNLALAGMLVCCLAIGIGAFGGARALYVQVQAKRAIEMAP